MTTSRLVKIGPDWSIKKELTSVDRVARLWTDSNSVKYLAGNRLNLWSNYEYLSTKVDIKNHTISDVVIYSHTIWQPCQSDIFRGKQHNNKQHVGFLVKAGHIRIQNILNISTSQLQHSQFSPQWWVSKNLLDWISSRFSGFLPPPINMPVGRLATLCMVSCNKLSSHAAWIPALHTVFLGCALDPSQRRPGLSDSLKGTEWTN